MAWTIDRLVPGGEGFTRADDGRATFVPGGLPGDVIDPVLIDERKRMIRVLQYDLLEAGPDRRDAAPCPAADRCGGCDWIELERPAQLRWKGEIVRDALRRIGGLELDVADATAAGPELGYRGRLRLHVRGDKVGFFERGSRRVVEIDACPVAAPATSDAIAAVRATARAHPAAMADVHEIELTGPPDGGAVAVRVVPRRGRGIDPVLTDALAEHLVVVDDDAPPAHAWPLPGGVTMQVPTTSFSQVNAHVNDALVQALVDGAAERGAKTFLDLYCGAGNFALGLLAAGLKGTGVEADPTAADAARRSADGAGFGKKARFLAESVAGALRRLAPSAGSFDLVVLDPPRSGARDAIPGVVTLDPAHIAAVSCDPATLARDLKALTGEGWTVQSVQVFDMFPQTHHAEVLAWLGR